MEGENKNVVAESTAISDRSENDNLPKSKGEKDVSSAKGTLPVGATEKATSSVALRLSSIFLTFITCTSFFTKRNDNGQKDEPKEKESFESTAKIASCKKQKFRKKEKQVKPVDGSKITVTSRSTEENSTNQGCFPCREIRKAIRKRLKKKPKNKRESCKQKKYVTRRTDDESESGKNSADNIEIKSLGFGDNDVEKISRVASKLSINIKAAQESYNEPKVKENPVTQITKTETNTNKEDELLLDDSIPNEDDKNESSKDDDPPPLTEANTNKEDKQNLIELVANESCKSEPAKDDISQESTEANTNKEDKQNLIDLVANESCKSEPAKDDISQESTETKSSELVEEEVEEITAESNEKEKTHIVIQIAEIDGTTNKEDESVLGEASAEHCKAQLTKDVDLLSQSNETKPLGLVDYNVEEIATAQEITEKEKENTVVQVTECETNTNKEDGHLLSEASSSAQCKSKLLLQDDVSPRWSEKRLKSEIPRPDLKTDVVRLITTETSDALTFPAVAPIELWGLVDAEHPELSAYMKFIQRKDPTFRPGWITDSIIDTYLKYVWGENECHKNVLVCSSLTHLMSKFGPINIVRPENYDKVVVPLNITGRHWTLLILDRCKKAKLYLDSMSELRKDNHFIRMEIEELSFALSCELKWRSKKWPIVQPSHPYQQDSYNCGIFTCVFARRAMNNKSFKKEIDPKKERLEMGNILFSLKTVEQHLNERDN